VKRKAVSKKKKSPKRATPRSQPVTGPERRKPVLIVQHAPHEHPAALLRALESQGILTHWIHPYLGDDYPEPDEVAGIVSLGGPMGANDEAEHSWILREMDLFRRSVELELPIVGICLGAQILARSLGGRVEKHAKAEVGWFPVQLNAKGIADPVIGAAGPSPTVYHWHLDTFYPPKGATLLASSRVTERQAYRIGEKIYGFQFHPEADHQLVLEWLAVEGMDQDIEAVQKEHGTETVQDSSTQRSHALRGEKGSLKITAAIASLFRSGAYKKVSREIHGKVQQWMTQRTPLVVEFECSERRPKRLIGTIMTLLTIPSGEFVIFQCSDPDATLWPIRLDDIQTIKPVA
jgi:GMP synthase (glutamine-hydrolysing)